MSNENNLLNELTYKAHIKAMPDRVLQEFTAEKIFELTTISTSNTKRIFALESRNKKVIGFVGGGAAVLGGIITTVFDFFGR